MGSRLFKSIGLDCLFGFACLSALTIAAIALHKIDNLTLFMLFGAALFFIAGLFRASSSEMNPWRMNPWRQGVAISMGASIPVIIVGWRVFSALATPLLWGFVILVALICGAAAQTQKLWRGKHRTGGAAIVLATVVLIVLAGKVIVPRLSALSDEQTMDKPAPDVTLAMLDGTPVSLHSLKGRVVVLDFWGTWCAPCIAEMPALGHVYNEFQGNKDVVFLAVNSEWNNDTPEKIRAFAEGRHLPIPVALDATDTAKKLDITSLPSLLFIDRQGNIRLEKPATIHPSSYRKN